MSVQIAMEQRTCSETGNVKCLLYDVKNKFVEGLLELKIKISRLAVEHYDTNEFEVTPQVIELMRDVVEYGI
jgi:hypothetical protein